MLKTTLLGLFVAGVAAAHEPRLLQLVDAIDIVPNADALRAAVAEPDAALLALADDRAETSYRRQRAATLLSVVPSTRGLTGLLAIAQSTPDPAVRWAAAYTVVRAFAASDPAALAFGERWARSAVLADRDAALRGLAWVPGAPVDALLRAALAAETDAQLRLVLTRALARRADR